MVIRSLLSSDSKGVLELPHRIMITVIVMAIVLPVILQSASTIEDNNTEAELSAECRYLADCVSIIYNQGVGSTMTVVLDLPEKTDLVTAGGALGDNSRSDDITIRYRTSGGRMQKISVKSGNNYISMTSADMASFVIEKGGENSIILKKTMITMDLNGDGLTPDSYVELSGVDH